MKILNLKSQALVTMPQRLTLAKSCRPSLWARRTLSSLIRKNRPTSPALATTLLTAIRSKRLSQLSRSARALVRTLPLRKPRRSRRRPASTTRNPRLPSYVLLAGVSARRTVQAWCKRARSVCQALVLTQSHHVSLMAQRSACTPRLTTSIRMLKRVCQALVATTCRTALVRRMAVPLPTLLAAAAVSTWLTPG